MMMTTCGTIHGHEIIETLGLVRGSAIRTRHIIADITEWFRNLVGAELHHYTKMMGETREQALDRMKQHARQVGADAVIEVRFATSNIASGASEIHVYGTAVKVRQSGG